MDARAWIFTTVVAVTGALLWLRIAMERRRARSLAAFAGTLGWRFTVGDRTLDPRHVSAFGLFTSGRSACAWNTLTAQTRSLHVECGDLRTTRGSGRAKHTLTCTYVVADLPGHRGTLVVHREGLLDKLEKALGGADLDVAADPEFSRRWRVRGDPALAESLLSAETCDLLERELGGVLRGTLEIRDELLLLHGPLKRRWTVAQLGVAIRLAMRFLTPDGAGSTHDATPAAARRRAQAQRAAPR